MYALKNKFSLLTATIIFSNYESVEAYQLIDTAKYIVCPDYLYSFVILNVVDI
jgi:hypothetical protein